jgi:hypothetical protein
LVLDQSVGFRGERDTALELTFDALVELAAAQGDVDLLFHH